MSVPFKSFDLFFGTGGVGKTTLAAARALQLAQDGKRVLLMTIDPARRLKDVLGLADEEAGNVVKLTHFPAGTLLKEPLHVLLMSADKTIGRIAQAAQLPQMPENRIIKILARPNGGMNEILAVVEIEMQLETGSYDCVVLDTPPGPHFLDFIDGLEKIRQFFDKRFMEIFGSIGRKFIDNPSRGFVGGVVNKFMGMGVHKLMGYLQKVTGAAFMEDFLQALELIYRSRTIFLKGLGLEKRFSDQGQSNWFLVTSVEQGKSAEALDIQAQAKSVYKQSMFLAINKTLADDLVKWTPVAGSKGALLKTALAHRENTLKEKTKQGFAAILDFPEVLSTKPQDHVEAMAKTWRQYVR